MKNTCIFYQSFRNAARTFSPEKRAAFYDMIFDYAMGDIEPPPDSEFIAHFELIRTQIDSDVAKYSAKVENGKKGGAPKGNQNAKKQAKTTENNLNQAKTSETSHNVYVNGYVNEDVNANVPTIVGNAHAHESFCKAYGIIADAEPPPFMDFEKLSAAYAESPNFLQSEDKPRFRRMSWIIKNYEKLITPGYFKDRKKNDEKHSDDFYKSLFTEFKEDD